MIYDAKSDLARGKITPLTIGASLLDAEAKALQKRINANTDHLIGQAAEISAGCPFEAIASLVLSAAAVASADGMNKKRFMRAVNIAWGQTEELRKRAKHTTVD